MNARIAIALALAVSVLSAQNPWDGKAGGLVKEGYSLLDQNKFNEALSKFKEAAQVDPKNSLAASGQAMAFFRASALTDKSNIDAYRSLAEKFAREALDLNDLDSMAMSVLKRLSGGTFESNHTPVPGAREAFQSGEERFFAKHYDEAITLYQKALELDSAYTEAALNIGDSYFAQQKYAEAEPWIKKATEMEPLYGRTWRFLFDCYGAMGRPRDAERAALKGIAAEPDNLNAWGRFRQTRKILSEKELERFKWPNEGGVQVSEKDGKKEVKLFMGPVEEGVADGGFWLTYNLMIGSQKVGDREKKSNKPSSPFEQECSALEIALSGLANALSDGKTRIKDPSLARLQEFKKVGHLETAIFLLHFREEFRPDFEEWKKGNPTGIEVFLALFSLRP